MTVPQALEIKEELEKIDELLKQLEEARETAQIGVDRHGGAGGIRRTGRHGEPSDALQQMVEDYLREMAERQGLERDGNGSSADAASVPPVSRAICWRGSSATCRRRAAAGIRDRSSAKARSKCSRPSRTSSAIRSRNMDIPQSLHQRHAARRSRVCRCGCKTEDIEIHRTRNTPKCATVVIMDMSGSMRYDGQYINVKRMGLALDGLIRSEYPGDYLHFIEMYTFAKPCAQRKIVDLLPKPVTIYDPSCGSKST